MESNLHIPRPAGTTGSGIPTVSPPMNVVVQAQALFQVLDHALRNVEGQERVFGTLLGVRSEDGQEVEVRSAYAVPHNEAGDEIHVGYEYNRSMYALHRKSHPKEVILGWFSTSSELNNYSALMHDLYSQVDGGTYPYPAIHLTVQTGNALADISVNTYISSPVGVNDKVNGNCLFVPVPNEVRYSEAEKLGLDAINQAKEREDRSVELISDMQALEQSIGEVQDMLERVISYVGQVIEGTEKGSTALGKYLLKSLSLVPSVSSDRLEKMFNSHFQDVLMVIYLSNTVKTQLQLSSRLTPLV